LSIVVQSFHYLLKLKKKSFREGKGKLFNELDEEKGKTFERKKKCGIF